MADGTTKAIADVQSGDEVVATDPETGTTGTKTVEAQHHNQDTDLTVTTHDGGKNDEATLHTTWHHPFWNETRQDWVYAQDLKTGDLLHTDTGALVEVKNVHNTVGVADMRDLTVEKIHTYYVVAGAEPVLVHNCEEDTYEHGGTTRYRGRDGLDRPQGASTVITKANSGIKGSEADDQIIPPGWAGNGTQFNQARGHLIGNLLKGSGTEPRNLVTLTQNPWNSPYMRSYEAQVRRRAIDNDEAIQYTVTPRYASDYHLVPDDLLIEAYGNKGYVLSVPIANPAAWQ